MPFEKILQDDFILRLIILYVCREYGDSITNPQLTKFIMDGQEVDYFNLQYNIYELVKMENLRVFTDGGKHYYELTDEGKETAGYFQSKIPMLIRKKLDEAILEKKKNDAPKTAVIADFNPEGGEFLAGIKILENDQEQFSLNVLVPTREHAIRVCQFLQEHIEEIYQQTNQEIMKLFSGESSDDKLE